MSDLITLVFGIGVANYFIGEGLKNSRKSNESIFIKKENLHHYLGISQEEIKLFLDKYPNIPTIKLGDKTYYRYKTLEKWLMDEKNF